MSGEKYPAKLVERVVDAVAVQVALQEWDWSEADYRAIVKEVTVDPTHSGDCAKECHTCIVCAVDEIQSIARLYCLNVLDAIPYAAMREALEKIAGGFIPGEILNSALNVFELTGNKLAFKEVMVTWCQETARAALRATDGEEVGDPP